MPRDAYIISCAYWPMEIGESGLIDYREMVTNSRANQKDEENLVPLLLWSGSGI